ncbi:hypothetical protein WN55_05045 [Dufourea novaeangliae]|uniref:Uncharacterized protein n=1 Tax=Dufourea novaeangliae TaxID=178035 RepID=A0A154PQ16_DUFNO|nr:hypothetical protein WN55_05045 [Dufourea novaeangliae]
MCVPHGRVKIALKKRYKVNTHKTSTATSFRAHVIDISCACSRSNNRTSRLEPTKTTQSRWDGGRATRRNYKAYSRQIVRPMLRLTNRP